jgi:iron complex transport system substrate-binding protein
MLFVCILAAVYSAQSTSNIIGGSCCATSNSNTHDYFPDKVSADFAEGFTVQYFSNYKVVTIPKRGEKYVLVQRGTTAPTNMAAGTVFITIPIERVAVLSNAYFPYFELLGERKSMRVTTKFDYLNEACLQKMALQDGLLDGVTNRDLSASNPFKTNNVDVIFRWSGSRDNDLANSIANPHGLPPVVRVDTGAEKTAAGFMEWIEYVSLFFNREREASRMVDEMKARYDCIVAHVRLQPKVRVLYSSFSYSSGIVKCSFSDSTWHKRMINEVGGEVIGAYPGYVSSAACDMTAFRKHAETADVWLYKSNNFQEGRYGSSWSVMWNFSSEIADVAAYKNGRTFDPNGNHFRDFWSSRIVQLDVELEDLVKILHPSLNYAHVRAYWLDVKTQQDPGRPKPASCTCKYGAQKLMADACPGNPKTAPQGNSKPNSDYGCNGGLAASVCNAHPMGASVCSNITTTTNPVTSACAMLSGLSFAALLSLTAMF